MNKRSFIILAVILLTLCIFTGCGTQISYKDNLDAYVRTLDYSDGFTILQLTDIHWSNGTQVGDESYGSKAYIKKVVDEAKAHAGKIDLIEVTGDTFMLADRRTVDSFIDFMTELQIPYAMVWGNHDREGKYNPNWIGKAFAKAPYCLYTEVDNDDVHERSNYVINLNDASGKTVWQIVNLDSGASYREGAGDLGLDYDYLREDQFDWMEAEHKHAGENVPVICYYHIAQAECQKAYDEIMAGSEDYKYKYFNHEGFSESAHAGTTSEIFARNNVKGVFMGHCHSTDFTYTGKDGITYGFGVKTGEELYYTKAEKGDTSCNFEVAEDFDVIGASLVTLDDAEGSFTLEHLYYNERDGKDFVMWVKY